MLILPAGAAAQEGYTTESIRFTPSEYHVGEQVELRLTLRVDENVSVSAPAEVPELSWINLKGIEVTRKGDITDIRILFASFQPGLKTLPSLDFGGIALEPVKIHTGSVLDINPPPFQNPRGQRLLPWTMFFLTFVIAMLLVVPVLILSLGPAFKHAVFGALSLRRRKRPFERLQKVIAELKDSGRSLDGDSFYSTLIHEFRRYLSDRTGEDFMAATSGEFSYLFEGVIADPAVAEELTALLKRGDGTRFGGRVMADQEYPGSVESVEKGAALIEKLMENKKTSDGEDA